MKNVLNAILIATITLLSTPSIAQEKKVELGNFLTTTTTDIGRPYDVLDGACVTAEKKETVGDMFRNHAAVTQRTMMDAFAQMQVVATQLGADALVGFDMKFIYHPSRPTGDVAILCGTLVKFKK